MSLPPLIGHAEARRRLALAHAAGRLPQVLLITGPAGVGKQRLALWLAQLVLCERSGAEPCGQCRACHLVGELSHSDLHWFTPIPRPKAGDPDKQVEEAAELIGEVLAERRKQPLYTAPDGMASHGVASARLLQRRAALTSVEGGRRIFIVGEAERLIPQESSQEAANALLKVLEEPPPEALFILTTTDARRLLPTMRSRVVPLRLGRLSDNDVRQFLSSMLQPIPGARELDERVQRAAGSIGAALAEGDADAKAYQAAADLLESVLAGRSARLERALKQGSWSARGDFSTMLDALADTLGEAARVAVGEQPRRPVPEGLLRRVSPAPLLAAQELVSQARESAAGNVNPQLLLAVLGGQLARTL
ncbi:MAG TPA: DNA polymerase III subunit [Gemmatimonadales bacterium]|nr:DNA polymerase III subunit [Gemmatimonadales bacterium]